MITLLVLAVIIVLALAGYAAYLHLLLAQRHRASLPTKEKKGESVQAASPEQNELQVEDVSMRDSARIIAQAVMQDELNLSEAVIRLKNLLDVLHYDGERRQPFAAIDQMFEQVSQFATHQQRLALSKKERMQQDLARTKIETEHRTQVLAALKNVVAEFS